MKPKRSLGQNFLRNKNFASSIVRYVLSSTPSQILEVGPGTGVFTHLFVKEGVPVIAIEKDDELARMLATINTDHLKLINRDILSFSNEEIGNLVEDPSRTVCFGSLPYNISKKIVSQFVPLGIFSQHYYILQKEVAQKYILGKQSSRSSVFINAFATPKIIMNIAPTNFYPVPKVISSLIHFAPLEVPLIEQVQVKEYEQFTKVLYSNPRKMIKKNTVLEGNPMVGEIGSQRAEELSLEQVVELFRSRKN